MPRYEVEFHVPCTTSIVLEAPDAEDALYRAKGGEGAWGALLPDFKGAEVLRATNVDTGEVTEPEDE
jgi:hypothetical protein